MKSGSLKNNVTNKMWHNDMHNIYLTTYLGRTKMASGEIDP